jgi:glycosidase
MTSCPKKKIPYYSQPDYTQPLLEITPDIREKLLSRLSVLYGEDEAKNCIEELERLLKVHYAYKPPGMIEAEKEFKLSDCFSHKDIILITYGDLLISEPLTPLETLQEFLKEYVRLYDVFSILHLLPFFPYSSDRGFSITDYRSVDPKLGAWKDIQAIGKSFRLMFDGVFNHISSQSHLFQEVLNGNPDYKDFATIYHSPHELTPKQREILVRPRTSDILSEYQSIDGKIWVWTTFSPDQIDLNYRNPKVLLFMIDTFLLYVRRGATLIRLDAVTYLWDEPGTNGVHLEQTHEVIKLLRDILDIVDPKVVLVTETNVPHEENISYFGNGSDEAQIIYNFALPPLVLYTFYQEDSTAISRWAKSLQYPTPMTNFLNMLDTHDGIGLMGVKNILSSSQINFIIEKAREHGALISYKTGAGGKQEPYEINSTWFSAINFDNGTESIELQVKRFIASRSLALALRGIPAIYFHGLIGTRNDLETVIKTKSKRDINRKTLLEEDLKTNLLKKDSKLSKIVEQLGHLLEIRSRQLAFHPNGEQKILEISQKVFSIFRISPDQNEHILAITNISNQAETIHIDLYDLGLQQSQWYDLVNRRGLTTKEQQLCINLLPYDVVWLIPLVELESMIESD